MPLSIDNGQLHARYRVLIHLYYLAPSFAHYLAPMETGSVTISDGSTTRGYMPVLLNFPTIHENIGQMLDPKFPEPDITLEIANADDYFTANLKQYNYWAHRQVKIYLWEIGTELDTTADLWFSGYVKPRGGVIIEDEKIIVRCSDFREKWNVSIPEGILDQATVDDMLSKSAVIPDDVLGKPMPMVFGDWTVELSGEYGFGCRALCIDTDAADHWFIVGRPLDPTGQLESIGDTARIIRDNPDVAGDEITSCDIISISKNLLLGIFQIDENTWTGTGGHYVYKEGDIVCVTVKGDAFSGTVIDNPVQLIRYLLLYGSSAATGDFDTTSYSAMKLYFDGGDRGQVWKARRQLLKGEKIWDLVKGLCREFGITVTNYKGTVKFSNWNPWDVDTGAQLIEAIDILGNESSEGRGSNFQTLIDPYEEYANRIEVPYCFEPDTERFKNIIVSEKNGITTDAVTKRVEFEWSYYRRHVRDMVDRIAVIFSRQPVYRKIDVGLIGLNLWCGDQVRITRALSGLAEWPGQIREAQIDAERGVATFTILDAFSNERVGRWTGPTANAWSTATDYEKAYNGFWTDASGRADSGDDASTNSVWI